MSRHDFNPKPFLKAATGFLEEKLAKFRHDLKGSPLEEHAIAYGRQEGWLLPNEGLEALTIMNLFPNAWPNDWAQRLATGQIGSEREAKIGLAEAMMADLREVNAALERMRRGVAEQSGPGDTGLHAPAVKGARQVTAHPGSEPANLTAGPQGGGHEHGLPPAEPLIARQSPAKGIPEACASSVMRIHRFTVAGVEFYTYDRHLMETVQAAQVQKVPLLVESIPGDHGLRATKAALTSLT